jgi:hypothetical protein
LQYKQSQPAITNVYLLHAFQVSNRVDVPIRCGGRGGDCVPKGKEDLLSLIKEYYVVGLTAYF